MTLIHGGVYTTGAEGLYNEHGNDVDVPYRHRAVEPH